MLLSVQLRETRFHQLPDALTGFHFAHVLGLVELAGQLLTGLALIGDAGLQRTEDIKSARGTPTAAANSRRPQ